MKRTLCTVAAVLALAMSVGAYAAEPVATELDSAGASDYVGYWTLSMEFQGNPVEMGLTIVDLDGKIGATVNSGRMPEPVAVSEASVDDSGITLTYDMDFGGNAFTIDIKATLEDGKLVGTLGDQNGLFSAEISGEKGTPPAPAPVVAITATELDTRDAVEYLGKWAIAMEMQGNPIEMVLTIVDVDGKVGASIDAQMIPEAVVATEATAGESGIKLAYDMDFGGNTFTINVEGRIIDDVLQGTFAEKSGLFSTEFTAEKDDSASVASEGGRRRRGGGSKAKLTLAGNDISIAFPKLKVDSDDYEALAGLKDGALFSYVGGRATKLRTDADLAFGDTVVEAENAAPNYPGVYSLWLKKVSDDDWRLVFNEDADIWGTQHEASADAVEIALKVGSLDEASETFLVELNEDGDGGQLRFAFGTMEWTADFTLAD